MSGGVGGEVHLAYVAAKARVFPLGLAAFSDPKSPLPLVIGVFDDLARLIGEDDAKNFLRVWTTRPEYRARIAAGGMRYRLDGAVGGEISKDDQGAALEIIARKTSGGKTKRDKPVIRTVSQAKRRSRRAKAYAARAHGKLARKLLKKAAALDALIESGTLIDG